MNDSITNSVAMTTNRLRFDRRSTPTRTRYDHSTTYIMTVDPPLTVNIEVCLFFCLVFNGTFSTYRLYRAIGV